MNLNFLKFLKFRKIIKKENFQTNINLFWKLLVLLFFVIIICGSFFVYNFFQKFNKNFYNIQNKNNEINIDRKYQINNVLNSFKEKENITNEVLTNNSLIIDPSL